MGIEASCKVKMCFIGDAHYINHQKSRETVCQILKNDLLSDADHIEAIGYRLVRKNNSTPPFFVMKYGLVTFEIDDDRNFWFERWGLKALKDKIDSWDVIHKLPENTDWYAGYSEFCKELQCMLDIDTWSDQLHQERLVIGVDGKILLEEESDGVISDDDITWSNPDYGKKSFEEIIEEHYAEYSIYSDFNSQEIHNAKRTSNNSYAEVLYHTEIQC